MKKGKKKLSQILRVRKQLAPKVIPHGDVFFEGRTGNRLYIPKDGGVPEEYVITPGGFRPKSDVHTIPATHKISCKPKAIVVQDEEGKTVLTIRKSRSHRLFVPSPRDGWQADVSWFNSAPTPVTLFTTSWTVPNEPMNKNSGQVIYLFNSIENPSTTDILQPVLQWSNTDPQCQGWSVSSWWIPPDSDVALKTKPVPVQVGQTVTGVIELVSLSNGQASYSCEFDGIPGTKRIVSPGQGLDIPVWCAVTLESHQASVRDVYPGDPDTLMSNINIKSGSDYVDLTWIPETPNGSTQQVSIIDGSANGGSLEFIYG